MDTFIWWFSRVLGPCLLVLVVTSATGCVSPETAAKYEAAKLELAQAKQKVLDIKAQLEQLKADYASGKLKANEMTAKLALLNTEFQMGLKEVKEATESVKTFAAADDPWWNKLGYVLLSLLGVATARKLGIPGLAHGTQPLPAVGGKPK
jgi:hypothetical protein